MDYKKILSVLFGIGVGVFLVGCGMFLNSSTVDNNKTFNKNAQANLSEARNTPIVQVAKKVVPAVVGITNKGYARDPFNRKVIVEQGAGSGVIFDKAGLIVTNNHVVEGAAEITVTLSDGRSFVGKVLGADPVTDLAVVKIDNADSLPVAEFGDSDSLMVGEPAIAIGNPLGLDFRGSVTAGVISALGRTIDIGEQRFELLQTDAAINPGNSGGALVNADGFVIGINSVKIRLTGVEGMGFAIPINAVKPIIKDIIEKGKVTRPYLGIGLLEKDMAKSYGYSINKGLLVTKVYEDSPAYKAGLRQGDVLLTFNGVEVAKIIELRDILNKMPVGQKVPVKIERNGKVETINITLEEIPQ